MSRELLQSAIQLATQAHAGQQYPSPESEPYIDHPLRVMRNVDGFEAQIIAVLHDVLEDTVVTVSDLRRLGIPDRLIAAVLAMTRRAGIPYEHYINQVAADPLARIVKIADLTDNLANNERLPQTRDVVERIDQYRRALTRLSF
jgi:(p)ppGpp synthase/HD superfamily hydrolase